MKTDHALFLLELSSLLKKNRATIDHKFGDHRLFIHSDDQELFAGAIDSNNLYKEVIRKGRTK